MILNSTKNIKNAPGKHTLIKLTQNIKNKSKP